MRVIALLAAAVWAALALLFSVQRSTCNPLFSVKCGRLAWEKLGDIVLFEWVNSWETLLGAFFALLAAVIGGRFILEQIRASDNLEKERRGRRRVALRAIMPMRLSELSEYVEDSVDFLRRVHGAFNQPSSGGAALSPSQVPTCPEDTVQYFVDASEICSREEADFIATLLSELQVQIARTRRLGTGSGRRTENVHNIEHYIINTATIQALVNGLFPFARRETDNFPTLVNYGELISVLRIMRFDEEEYISLYEKVRQRAARGPIIGARRERPLSS